jgi:hypothetical protein
LYQGLVDYYSTHVPGFPAPVYLPEPPVELRAAYQGDSLRLSWQVPPFQEDRSLGDRPTGYRVYRSLNGYGFDAGTEVASTNIALRDLPPDRVVYLRVTAINAGGESLPSETVAVRTRSGMRPEVLLVNGFNRLDEGLNAIEENGAVRGILAKMNTFDYAVQHGAALDRAGVRFDFVNSKVLEKGAASLSGYKTVVWIAGRQGGSVPVFSDEEIRLLSTYLQGGGSLFLSGAHVASELDQDDVGRLFLQEALGARFAGTIENPNSAQPSDEGAFQDLGRVEFGGVVGRSYPVPVMDLIEPVDGTIVSLYVTSQDDQIVGVQQTKIGKSIFLTVPFETIDDSAMRAAIMERAMQFLVSRESKASQVALRQ